LKVRQIIIFNGKFDAYGRRDQTKRRQLQQRLTTRNMKFIYDV